MIRFYNYIYYRAYIGWMKKHWGEGTAVWGSSIELGMLILLNVLGTAGLVQFILGYRVFEAILHAPTWQQGSVLLVFSLALNRIWGDKDNARQIVKGFEKVEETPRQRFWRGVGINLYEASSLLLFIGCSLFVH